MSCTLQPHGAVLAKKQARFKDITRDAASKLILLKADVLHRQQHKKSRWLSTVDNTFESDVILCRSKANTTIC